LVQLSETQASPEARTDEFWQASRSRNTVHRVSLGLIRNKPRQVTIWSGAWAWAREYH
jgi:hypothetical protein